MRKKPVFALIYDFDGTIAPGNMQERDFIPAIKMNTKKFWKEVSDTSKQNQADNILVYMKLMLDKAAIASVQVREENFRTYGRNFKYFEGVLPYKNSNEETVKGWFDRINEYGKQSGILVEHYIVSSGIKEMIDGTVIARKFKKVYASSFFYDHHEIAVWPSLAINYTTKTQYIFRINKGCLDVSDSKKINEYTPEEERSIPFRHMVYIGATPAEFVVKDGSNRIILRKKYYADKEITINAEKNDQDFIFNLEVDRKSVNIGIETKPGRAVVRLNEKAFLPELRSLNNLPVYSGTSLYNSQIPIGRYDIKIEKKGFNTIEKEIIVEKNENLSFNLKPLKYHTKGTALLLSVVWPGTGQSYLKRGSAHLLMGFAGYGALAYSFFQHSLAVKNYDLYLAENNPQTRESLKSEYKNNLNMSDYAMYAGAAVWGVNLIWPLVIPSEQKKYRNVQFSLLKTSNGSVPTIGWRSDF